MARIPHHGTFDDEIRLPPGDIKCLHLEDGLISHQVRVYELTFTECLQGARNDTPERNIVPLVDIGRRSY